MLCTLIPAIRDGNFRNMGNSCIRVVYKHLLISSSQKINLTVLSFAALFPQPNLHRIRPSDLFDYGELSCSTAWQIHQALC